MQFRTHIKPKDLPGCYQEEIPTEYGYYYVVVYDQTAKSYHESLGYLDEFGWRIGLCSVSNKEITEKHKQYRFYLIGPPVISVEHAVRVNELIEYLDKFVND